MKTACRLIFLLILLITNELAAQEITAISSDRPAETDAVSTLPKGYWQVESGIAYTRFESAGNNSAIFSIPAFLIKYGVSNALELRVFYTSVFENFKNSTENGMLRQNIFSVSGKANIAHENGWVPEITLILNWNYADIIREGSKLSSKSEPGFRIVFSNTLSDKVSIAYSVGHIYDYSFTLVPVLVISPKSDLFLEYYTSFNFGNINGFYSDGLNFGYDYLFNDNFKMDVMIGAWLDTINFNGYMSTGIAWRFK